MKKTILLIFIWFILPLGANAKTIKVEALQDFSTQNPTAVFSVKTTQYEEINNNFIEPGTKILGEIIKIQGPKRGKRDGYLEFVPKTWTSSKTNGKIEVNYTIGRIIGYEPVDPKGLAFNVTRKVANFLLKGAVSAAEFTHGAITAEKGQKIKTGLNEVYKDSFISYVEFGENLNIHTGDILLLKLTKVRK